jgi:hypothetical protein
VIAPNVETEKRGANVYLKRDEDGARKDAGREIAAATAANLARKWLKVFGRYQVTLLSEQAGAAVVPATLVRCGDARYAAATNRLPTAAMERHVQLAKGSWWLVTFCDEVQPRVVIAVASLSHPQAISDVSDVETEQNLYGSEFMWRGLPNGKGPWVANSPETAVVYAATQTGAKIRSLPVLVSLPLRRGGPFRAMWRVELDREINANLVTTNTPVKSSVFYVGGASNDPIPQGAQLFAEVTPSNASIAANASAGARRGSDTTLNFDYATSVQPVKIRKEAMP